MKRTRALPYLFSALTLTACLNLGGIVTHAGEQSKNGDAHDYYRETIAGNYLASRFAQTHNDWEKASHYINRLTTIDPNNGTLQQRAMILAMGSGKVSSAIAHARDVLKDEPDNLWALMFATIEAMQHKDYKNAEAILNSMPDDGIASYVSPILKTWAQAGENNFEARAAAGNSIHFMHVIFAADYLGHVKDLPKDMIEQAKTMPLDPIDLEKIADVFAYAGMTDDATTLYSTLHADMPGLMDIDEKLQHLESGKPLGDLRASPKFTSAEQGMSEAMFDIARVLYREHNDESAQIFANMALGLDANMTKAKILLAHIQQRNERYDNAFQYYDSISPNDPLYKDIQFQAADMLHNMKRYDEAIALLEKLYTQYGDIQALVQIGDAYRTQEDYDNAIKTYNRAFKQLTKDANGQDIGEQYWVLYYARGMSYEQNKEWDKGEADLRQALVYQPEHPYLLNYLGYSMADRGKNLTEALDMIERAVELRPRDGYIADSLGWVHYRMGNYAQSVAPLEKAVELLPYDPTINDHLGDAYWQVGRQNEARFQWTRAINNTEDEDEIEAISQKIKFGPGNSVAEHSISPDTTHRLNR